MNEDPAVALAREKYDRLRADHPELFAFDPAGVQIVVNPVARAVIEAEMAERMRLAGQPAHFGRAGLFYEDAYIWVLRDAVIFPDGRAGIHHRVVVRDAMSGINGIAVLPIFEGRIVLLRHYRHAVGEWCWEGPRGGVETGVTPPQAVEEELTEELGALMTELVPLGTITGMSGLIRGHAALYLARLSKVGNPALCEGIGEIRLVDVPCFEKMVLDDEIQDGFLLSAFAKARLQGLI